MLKDEPDITFSVEFTALQEMGYNSDDVQLGNGVYLIDDRMQIESTARIVAICELYKLLNDQLVKDTNRSPIATISNVQKTISPALVQQQKQQAQIERTAVKQQKIYNGCTISPEDRFKATAINGITAFLKATEGIAILNGEVYKFYVNPQGKLVLDGRLYNTKDGGTPLFGAYSDAASGILKIFDKDGKLNVAIGSNFFDTEYTGGALKLYNDGSSLSDQRVEMGIYRVDSTGNSEGEAGFLHLMDGNNNERISIEGVSYSTGETRIILRNVDGTSETEIIAGAVYVDGEPLATKADLDALETELKELIRQEIRDLKDYVDDEAD